MHLVDRYMENARMALSGPSAVQRWMVDGIGLRGYLRKAWSVGVRRV